MIEEKRKNSPKWLPWIIIAVVVVCLIGIVVCLSLGGLVYFSQESSNDSPILEVVSRVENIFVTDTPTPTATATQTPSPTPTITPTLGLGSIRDNSIDGASLIYVPAGEFLMGSESSEARDNEAPEHYVFLDAYWIYKNEVTNAQFAAFVNATGYETSAESKGYSRLQVGSDFENSYGTYWEVPYGVGSNISGKDDYPVIHTSWLDAEAFCSWAGGRLPTEAEWEKAARGTDGRTYPWGETELSKSLANYDSDILKPVGSYPSGMSPYGLMDMAGNVWEWIADWYDEDYYNISPSINPLGPTSGTERMLKGGGLTNTANRLRSANRFYHLPEYSSDFLGFRCVVDVMP